MKTIVQGLAIFLQNAGTFIAARKDIIYAGQAEGVSLSEVEVETLLALGWRREQQFCNCPRTKDDLGEYNVVHGLDCNQWSHFT